MVPVKVMAENDAIQPGNLLTSSGTSGPTMQAGQAARYTVERQDTALDLNVSIYT